MKIVMVKKNDIIQKTTHVVELDINLDGTYKVKNKKRKDRVGPKRDSTFNYLTCSKIW